MEMLTLVEDNTGVVSGSCSTEWSLLPNANSVDSLKGLSRSKWNKNSRALTFEWPMISPMEEPVSKVNACPNLPERK